MATLIYRWIRRLVLARNFGQTGLLMRVQHILLIGAAALGLTACGEKKDEVKAKAKVAGEKTVEAGKAIGEAAKAAGAGAVDATKEAVGKAGAAAKKAAGMNRRLK